MAGSCVNAESSAAQMALELLEYGELYLALSVILEAMNRQPQHFARHHNHAEWCVLVEILNRIAVHRAAEKAFEITSFFDRSGLQPHDDYDNENHSIHSHEQPQDQGPRSFRLQPQTYSERHRNYLSSSLVSDTENQSSLSDSHSTVVTSCRPSITKWSQIRHGTREWKKSIKTYFKSVFRKKSDREHRPKSNQDEHLLSSSRHSSFTSRVGGEDEYSATGHGRHVVCPVTEQSSSRSRSCGLWALSECDIMGMSGASEAARTSYAIMEDQCTPRQASGNPTELGHRRSIVRFFESFRLRSRQPYREPLTLGLSSSFHVTSA